MATRHVDDIRRRVRAESAAGSGISEFATTLLELLRQAVPFDAACLATADPRTGLVTGTYKVDLPDARDWEFSHFEYEVEDYNKYAEIALRPDPVGVLHDDTDGSPERSARWRDFLMPHFGHSHELRGAFRDGKASWGLVGLYRSSDSSGFSPAEADFIAGLTDSIAVGIRAALVTSMATGNQLRSTGPAVLVVDRNGHLQSATPAALEVFTELGGVDERVPMPLVALAAAARGFGRGQSASVPRVRLRLGGGEWLVAHAAPLSGADDVGSVAVTIEPAHPGDVVPLLVAAYGLSTREREVVRQVLSGAGTAEIARSLHLSPYTVQDHLKAVFDKVGVRSRRELTAKVFFDHYAERIGDPLSPSGWFRDADT